jgi:hypothetical protein
MAGKFRLTLSEATRPWPKDGIFRFGHQRKPLAGSLQQPVFATTVTPKTTVTPALAVAVTVLRPWEPVAVPKKVEGRPSFANAVDFLKVAVAPRATDKTVPMVPRSESVTWMLERATRPVFVIV